MIGSVDFTKNETGSKNSLSFKKFLKFNNIKSIQKFKKYALGMEKNGQSFIFPYEFNEINFWSF